MECRIFLDPSSAKRVNATEIVLPTNQPASTVTSRESPEINTLENDFLFCWAKREACAVSSCFRSWLWRRRAASIPLALGANLLPCCPQLGLISI